MSMPGSDLSQPASSTEPSSRSANITVSTESAMTSRETSEARIPSCPMEMPSETEIVPNSSGQPQGGPAGSEKRADPQREAAGGAHALLGPLGQPVEGQVARGDLVPGRRDTDLRLGEVVVAHAHRAEHRTGGRLGDPVGHLAAARLDVCGLAAGRAVIH